ncbi:MAG TPA: hypothetical protein DCQ98_19585 [Planctomycetaceae bacterium]|nr:hypothetical protein [Planctomycetaceae bacterium]HRF02725.1 RusA family crossover junction endodeoxyribonuclease [Pirellulaceae bacterium]
MIELSLPFPPSVNHYWRRVGARTLVSRTGRAYRATIVALLRDRAAPPLQERLTVEIEVHPPDRRRRDLDNLLKALIDALAHAGLYADDSQIDRLLIERRGPLAGGRVVVRLGGLSRD